MWPGFNPWVRFLEETATHSGTCLENLMEGRAGAGYYPWGCKESPTLLNYTKIKSNIWLSILKLMLIVHAEWKVVDLIMEVEVFWNLCGNSKGPLGYRWDSK